MANSTVSAGGNDYRTLTDSSSNISTKTTIEFADGTPEPTTVSSGNPLPVTTAAALAVVGAGAETTALRVALADEASVAVTGSVTVADGGGSLTVDGSVTASCAGDVAHDAADSGNPVKVGGVAAADLPTAVAEGDRAQLVTDLHGRLLTAQMDPTAQVWQSADITTTQTGGVLWAPAAGKKIAITRILVASKSTTAGRVILWFGANGDSTYNAGSDQLVAAFTLLPSATEAPGYGENGVMIYAETADHELKITTDAAINLDVVVYGFEF